MEQAYCSIERAGDGYCSLNAQIIELSDKSSYYFLWENCQEVYRRKGGGERPVIVSADYFEQERSTAILNSAQAEFFELLPDKRLKIEYAKIVALPEYAACRESFARGADKFSGEEMEQLRSFISEWLKALFKGTSTTMWRSTMYGTASAAEALAALANRLGFSAHVENPYGDAEMDFAVVVDGTKR